MRDLYCLDEINKILIVVDNKNDFKEMTHEKIEIIEQPKQIGLGDAIHKCKDYINEDYYMLVLGDMLYKSKKKNCCQQLLDYHKKVGKQVIGLRKIPLFDIPINGMVSGKKKGRVIEVEDFIEKPGVKYAKTHCIKYGVFGNYVLSKDSFKYLDKMDLCQYLDISCKTIGLDGYIIDGKSFDIGTPKNYYKSFKNYNKN